MTKEEEGQDLWHRVVRGVRENRRRNKIGQGETEQEQEQKQEREQEQKKGDGEKAGKKEKVGSVATSVALGRERRGEQVGQAVVRRGLDKRSARRLRKGEMMVEERIDLHGMTRKEARAVLCVSLRRCQERGLRCVLVISGKGQGVLREEVLGVLGGSEVGGLVVEHYEARLRDGGEGARYVLLRRRR